MTTTAILQAPPSNDLASTPTDQLKTELMQGLALTAAVLARLAAVWAELERRGEDLSVVRTVAQSRMLPLIAHGQLAAEAVAAFIDRTSILWKMIGMPLEDQRLLADRKPVAVIDETQPDQVMYLPLHTMPARAVRRAIANGRVVPPDEQRLALRPKSKLAQPSAQRIFHPKLDRDTGRLKIGNMEVEPAEIMDALHAGAGPDFPPGDLKERQVKVHAMLSDVEAEAFRDDCRRLGFSESEMIRKALRAFALIRAKI